MQFLGKKFRECKRPANTHMVKILKNIMFLKNETFNINNYLAISPVKLMHNDKNDIKISFCFKNIMASKFRFKACPTVIDATKWGIR